MTNDGYPLQVRPDAECLLLPSENDLFISWESDYGPDSIARVVVLVYDPILVPPGMKTLMVGVTV